MALRQILPSMPTTSWRSTPTRRRQASHLVWRPVSRRSRSPTPLDRLTDWRFQTQGPATSNCRSVTGHTTPTIRGRSVRARTGIAISRRAPRVGAGQAVAAFERAALNRARRLLQEADPAAGEDGARPDRASESGGARPDRDMRRLAVQRQLPAAGSSRSTSALTTPSATSEILIRKAGFSRVGERPHAEEQEAGDRRRNTTPVAATRDKRPARAASGKPRNSPSTRRSSVAIEPTTSADREDVRARSASHRRPSNPEERGTAVAASACSHSARPAASPLRLLRSRSVRIDVVGLAVDDELHGLHPLLVVVARAVADRGDLVAGLGGVLVEAGGAGARRRGELDGPQPVLGLDLQRRRADCR